MAGGKVKGGSMDSIRLCEKCHEWGESKSAYIRPWDHCHHEEEKKKCICGAGILGEGQIDFWKRNHGYKFCPFCGRKI